MPTAAARPTRAAPAASATSWRIPPRSRGASQSSAAPAANSASAAPSPSQPPADRRTGQRFKPAERGSFATVTTRYPSRAALDERVDERGERRGGCEGDQPGDDE